MEHAGIVASAAAAAEHWKFPSTLCFSLSLSQRHRPGGGCKWTTMDEHIKRDMRKKTIRFLSSSLSLSPSLTLLWLLCVCVIFIFARMCVQLDLYFRNNPWIMRRVRAKQQKKEQQQPTERRAETKKAQTESWHKMVFGKLFKRQEHETKTTRI